MPRSINNTLVSKESFYAFIRGDLTQICGFNVAFTLKLFSNFISNLDLFPELHSSISTCLLYIFT